MNLAALAAAACLFCGYELGRVRPIDRLDRLVWRRIMFGPSEGSRPLGWLDATAWTVLHPVEVARAHPRSPLYRPPAPRPSIDALDLMPKEKASDRANS